MIHISHLPFDVALVFFFNKFCGSSIFLDNLLLIFLSVDALRTAILVSLVVGIWSYGKVKKDINSSKRVLFILFSIIFTLAIIEVLNALINSPRPIVSYSESINAPLLGEETKELWKSAWVRNPKHNAFPSDTIALLSTMAVGLFLWNKTIGIFAFIFVILTGVIPRLYFGLHYPSDMLCGIIISFASSIFIERIKFFNKLGEKLLKIENKFPYFFGTIGFYISYIISDKFILLRKLPIWIKVMLGN